MISWCKGCGRYGAPPHQWVVAQLESRELLAYCLKRVKNLNKVRLVDAGFVYTEPHSKRLKVKLKVQKEVFVNTILEQTFIVEYVVQYEFCPDCHKQATPNTWVAVVQARQKVTHKRTFLYLEQVILKYNMQGQCLNIKQCSNGLDFFFAKKSAAVKFTEFLGNIVPIRVKTSEQLISRDEQNSVCNYKYTYSVELVPICREDLLYLPKGVAMSLGHISQLVLCRRVTTNIQIIDPYMMKTGDLQGAVYWREPFAAMASGTQMVEFVVIDIMPYGPIMGTMRMADVAVVRSSDFGRNDQQFIGKTHLGNILKVGDAVLGYDLSSLNFNSHELEIAGNVHLPDFILVKKHYSHRRSKRRHWKLQDLPKEETEGFKRKEVDMKDTEDYEYFLRELEEDKELRVNVNLYKDANTGMATATEDEMTDAELEDAPQVPLEELLDSLTIQDTEMAGNDSVPGLGF
jgi:nonsense-mediated mRNA decay protein 3